jgi:hypothetical protein
VKKSSIFETLTIGKMPGETIGNILVAMYRLTKEASLSGTDLSIGINGRGKTGL